MIDARDATPSRSNGAPFHLAYNVESLGAKFLGPALLSVFIGGIETGMIIVLFARFFVQRRERLAIQFLVYFVTFASLYVAFEHLLHCKSIF